MIDKPYEKAIEDKIHDIYPHITPTQVAGILALCARVGVEAAVDSRVLNSCVECEARISGANQAPPVTNAHMNTNNVAKEDIFFMVYNPIGTVPHIRHLAQNAADKEAERIAIKEAAHGHPIYVLRTVAKFQAPPVAVTKTIIT